MKFFSPKFRLLLPAFMLALTIFLFAGDGGYATLFTTTANPDAPDFARTEPSSRHFAPPQAMSSACGSLRDTTVGSLTGAATYDACNSDTISISANQFPTSSADRQYNVQREVCGDGEVIVKVLSVSGGMAGLELRADNAPGAKKVGLRTSLGNLAQRFLRTTTDAGQSSGNVIAGGHRWLKLVRSGSSVSVYTSTNGSNWNFASTYTISLPDCVQATLFMQSINANTTHTGVFNNLQFSGFTNPEGDPTTVAFDQDTISADAGDTVMICVNIANPCVCSPTEVDVELQGSGAPHLSGYSTETLVFEDTTGQECFPLVISGAAGSANYTLSLDNVSGGNGAETETPASLIIAVTGIDDGSPLTCGVGPLMSNSAFPNEPPIAFDRFGNEYVYSQLLPPVDTGSISSFSMIEGDGFEGCGCSDVGIDLELFTLWFEDCAFETASGFAVMGQEGEERRKVMCAAFQYLESLITPNTSVCEPNIQKRVNVRIQPSVQVANYYGVTLPSFTNSQTLGYASPYFPNLGEFNPGIEYTVPQIILTAGEYPLFIPPDGMHGMVRINFNHTWHLDYTSATMPTSTEDDPLYDLFTASLHEAMHMLGFVSSFTIPEDLQGNTNGVGRYFSFDRFLQLNQSGGQPLIVNDAPSPSDDFPRTPVWRFNPAINPATEMFQSCLGATTAPDMEFTGSENYPIFTGATFFAGASFSHLEGACDVTEPDPSMIHYVMHPFLHRSVDRRELHEDEVDIMARIGYAIGEDDCAVGAAADGNGHSCGDFVYSLKICPPAPNTLSIPLADLRNNDPNAAEVAYIIPMDGSGTGQLNLAGTHYNFTASQAGTAQLAYAILGCSGELGNVNIITVNVVLDSSNPQCLFYCPATVSCNDFPGASFCEEWTNDCEEPGTISPCNLVCNSELCGTVFHLGVDVGNNDSYVRSTFNPLSGAPIIPGWSRVGGKTANYYRRLADDNSFFHFGFNSQHPGQLMTFVPIESNKPYLYKFLSPETTGNDEGAIILDLIKGEDLAPGAHVGNNTAPVYNGPVLNIFDRYLLDNESIEEQYASCFFVSSQDWQDYSAILLTSPGLATFDKFELIEDNFTAGPDVYTAFCSEPVQLGGGLFCMLSDVEVEYEWLQVEPDGQGGENMIEIASYRILNGQVVSNTIIGNIDPVTLELTVAPGQTTTYRLRRSVYESGGLTATFDFCKTEPDGTVTTDCNKEDDATVFVAVPYPDAEFNFNESVCRFNFTSREGMEDLTHEWDFGSLATPSTSTNVNPGDILLPVGTHTVTHTITGICGVDTYSEEISVTPGSNAEFTFNESVCMFDFTSSEGMEDLTHEWDFGSLATPSTSTTVNPGGILLPGGTHTVTHTVTGICGVDTYSEEISVTPGSNAVFTLAAEACGLVTFSLTGLLSSDTWEIDYGNGDSGSSLVYNYSLTPATYTATISITSVCESVEIPLEVEIEGCPELACCPNTSSMLLVNTLISDAIAAGLPPGGTSSDICIEGILMVDEDYAFSGNLFLGPDARIVVTSEATLELDGAHLQGCDFLWRGIEIAQPHADGIPSLISHNETIIEDAKLAVAASAQVQLDIRETTFDRNYIGLYLNGVALSGFYENIFDCTEVLKPSFSSAPNIGDYSYAGIQSQGGALHIGVAGTVINTFQNLRNGIINLRGPMTVENSVFHNIEKAPDEPYDITGYGIHHRGTSVAPLDQRGLGYGATATLTFDNCYTAIWAEKCNVKARFNRMADVHTGIQAQYCKNANLNIDHNRIACYGIGISLLQNDPANSIRVWENHLHVNENSPTNAAGAGIFVQESGSQQFNAIIEQNPVYLYRKDKGIFLNTTTGYTVRDNDVFLESATVNDAMGIVMEKSALGRVSCNDIVGVGKGDGLVSRTTSTTLYSCNTVENLSIGAAFDGASGSTYLQTTEFVPPLSQGLVYKENIAMMPAQSHRGNRWNTGTYGNAAAVHEGSGAAVIFFDQRFEIHTLSAPYYPPSISLPNSGSSPSSWFAFTGTSPFSICNPTVECPVFGFAPDKDEVKDREEQLAGDEFAGEWPGGLHWAAQWQLYEMLERSPGIRDTSTTMASYYTGKEAGDLGRLHALQKGIDTLFQLLPEQQDTLQQYIEQTETLMEALVLADSMAVHAPLSATPGLPQQLLAQCDSLLSLSEALVDEVFDARAAIIDTLFAQNAAIADTAIYIVNEKVVNEIYLSTLKQDSLALDTLETDTLYAIATQCPETGGPAVYRARSLYALIAMVDFDTINCKFVSSLQSPPQQALAQLPDMQVNFRVFPNPNQGRFTIAYELEQDGTLVLTDILGRQAATTSLLADTRSKEVSASELKAGLYYLHIVSGNGELLYSNRIIIIH